MRRDAVRSPWRKGYRWYVINGAVAAWRRTRAETNKPCRSRRDTAAVKWDVDDSYGYPTGLETEAGRPRNPGCRRGFRHGVRQRPRQGQAHPRPHRGRATFGAGARPDGNAGRQWRCHGGGTHRHAERLVLQRDAEEHGGAVDQPGPDGVR